MHTNPIVISFCSILYYKYLEEYVKRYLIEKKRIEDGTASLDVKLKTFNGQFPKIRSIITNKEPKDYRKKIVNRWHLLVKLNQNKILLKYRKLNKYSDIVKF